MLHNSWDHYKKKPIDRIHAIIRTRKIITDTDKHLRLVMTLIALDCTRQSRAPNFDRCTPENQPWPLTLTRDLDPDPWPWYWPLTLTLKQGNSDVKTRFWAFDLDLWPTTLTYIARLAEVKVNLHAKDEGRRLSGLAGRVVTDSRMDATKYIIFLAWRSIMNPNYDALEGSI